MDRLVTPNREELAYAGGLFEGEGCVSIFWPRNVAYPYARLTIFMTDVEPLIRFQDAVGGLGHVSGPYKNGTSKLGRPNKPRYSWSASSFEHAQAVTAMLWPWLGPRRRARAVEVFDQVARWAEPDAA